MPRPPQSRETRFTRRFAASVAAIVLLVVAVRLAVPLALTPWAYWRQAHRPATTPANRDDCVPERPPFAGRPGHFTDITDESGLDFEHRVGPLGTYFMPESVGAGGGMFDYDNDGRLDVYLVNCGRSPHAVGDFPPGTRLENRLFRQEAQGAFVDVTAASGLGELGYGMSCAIGDIDDDGFLDVFIANYGESRLFHNNGDGTFSDISEAAGIQGSDWAIAAAFLDYDRDGCLDLFVVNYTEDPWHDHTIACGFYSGRVSYCGPLKFRPTVDRLYRNEGAAVEAPGRSGAKFRDVTEAAGIAERATYGMGVVSADFNGDGWPDVYVANDASFNRLWINQRDGSFRDEASLRGADCNVGQGTPEGSMGIALGDLDGDGELDLVVSNLRTEGLSVFRNEGEGVFVETARPLGLARLTTPHTGWGIALVDLNHSGELDLPLVNGMVVPCDSRFAPHGEDTFVRRSERIDNPAAYWRDYADLNRLFLNRGQGRFEDASAQGGDFCSAVGSGRALIYGDIDNDGDLDLLVTNCGGRARLYRNDAAKLGAWLQVRLIDRRGQRNAYGAEVRVQAGGRRLLRTMNPAGSYQASHDLRLHFGLGDAAHYDAIRVRWPDGAEEFFPSGPAERLVVLRRGDGAPVE